MESIEANATLIVNGVNVTGIDIESGLTRIQAQAAADEFSITFTTDIDEATDTTNALLNTAYNAIDDDDFEEQLETANDAIDDAEDAADDVAKATGINTALTTFRTAINTLAGDGDGDAGDHNYRPFLF